MTAVEIPHHHRDRNGVHIDELTWAALRSQIDYCVIAEYRCATEAIQAVWHGDGETYDFALVFDGGKHNGIQIHCASEKSVMALFDATVHARKTGVEPFWLTPIRTEVTA